jgi:hypothetical protein
MTAAELKQIIANVERLTVLEVPAGSVLVVHVPHDSDYRMTGEAFRMAGFKKVIIDPVDCTFSAIKKGEEG